jgi:hypothetical protein
LTSQWLSGQRGARPTAVLNAISASTGVIWPSSFGSPQTETGGTVVEVVDEVLVVVVVVLVVVVVVVVVGGGSVVVVVGGRVVVVVVVGGRVVVVVDDVVVVGGRVVVVGVTVQFASQPSPLLKLPSSHTSPSSVSR